jgi:glycosyltransferase involved in cell wall biosynthesis
MTGAIQDDRPPALSVVVPVFNSRVLEDLVRRIDQVLSDAGLTHEILLVDDGSPGTAAWGTIAELAQRYPSVRGLRLSRNFGQHAATLCGLAHAAGARVATMDDDLQHQPEDLPRLLAAADHDIVIARFAVRHHGLGPRLTSVVKAYFDRLLIGKPRDLQLTAYRLLRRHVVDGMLAVRTSNPFLPALMFRVSRDVVNVDVPHAPRVQGRSTYTTWRRLALFGNLIFNNSSLLLRVAVWAGLAFAAAAFGFAALVVYRKLVLNIRIQGWSSTMAAILLLGGLNLATLGIVGEYLLRIVRASERTPAYFVRETTDGVADEVPGRMKAARR